MNNLIILLAFMSVTSVFNIIAFFIGAKVGQKVSRQEEIKIPNPVTVVNDYKEDKKRRKEQEELEIMKYNIDIFDGTGLGQKDI